MVRNTIRLSRKRRRCGFCHTPIYPGQRYLECVISPDHGDVGNTTWWRDAECEGCATRYGRWTPKEVAA